MKSLLGSYRLALSAKNAKNLNSNRSSLINSTPTTLTKISKEFEFSKAKFFCSDFTKESNQNQLGKIAAIYQLHYTCGVCNERSYRNFSKKAYHEGVVIIQCLKCENRHLIADNLGWFEDTKITLEDIMKRKGETIAKGITTYEYEK